MQGKNGFTLIELLAVIGIIGILMMIASSAVISILNKQKEALAKDTEQRLKDAAVSYIQEKSIKLTKCPTEFNPANPNPSVSTCYRKIKVSEIINSGLFDDFQGYCDKTKEILVYKETKTNYTDLKAFSKEQICK